MTSLFLTAMLLRAAPASEALPASLGSGKFLLVLNGQTVGSSTLTVSDQVLKSTTSVRLGGTDIASALEARLAKAGFSSFKLAESASAKDRKLVDAELTFDGKKSVYDDKIAKKRREVAERPSLPMMANWHPGLLSSVTAKVDWKKREAQTVKTYLFEALQTVPITIKPTSTRSFISPGGAVEIKTGQFDLGGLKADIVASSKGEFLGLSVPSQKFSYVRAGYEGIFVDPMAKFPELSPATETVVEEPATMTTSDGVKLVATVVRPERPGKYPVILSRTPYGRATALNYDFAKRGYVFVSQDVRGTGESTGRFRPMINERKDGKETLDWVAAQPWCNGNIGMIGASYGGFVQWAAAVDQHPALRCIIPQVSPPGSAMKNIPYENGVFMLIPNLWWLRIVDRPGGVDLTQVSAGVGSVKSLGTYPLSKVDDQFLKFDSVTFNDWLTREGEAKWDGWNFEPEMKAIKIPVLHVSGWFDGDALGTKRNWQLLREAGHQNQWLIYGPWEHAFNAKTSIGNLDFGKDSVIDLDSVYLRFFDTFLKQKEVQLANLPKVKVFFTGTNRWVTSDQWPLRTSTPRELQIEFGTRTKGPVHEAKLVPSTTKAGHASYVTDPKKLSKRVETELGSMTDTAGTELTFKRSSLAGSGIIAGTPPLAAPLKLSGPLSVEFDFKSSAVDTDFYAMLYDFNGKVYRYLTSAGKLRAAFVNGLAAPVALKPGQTYRAKIEMWDLAHEFKKGHRLVLVISSSMFPLTAQNLGTMEPIATGKKMVPQRNTIFSSPGSPARLTFYASPN